MNLLETESRFKILSQETKEGIGSRETELEIWARTRDADLESITLVAHCNVKVAYSDLYIRTVHKSGAIL